MCGIIGQVNRMKRISKKNFILMRDTLAHRGPDAAGLFFDEQHKNIALGHRRLSIIDLSDKGIQPMSNENGTIWITFNGEIYNYLELKKQLGNHSFKSETDTEVLLHAYEEWGFEATLVKLNGMFSFCIYDQNVEKMFCARDRIGIKPFVYYFNNETFIFSSEVKAIVSSDCFEPEINTSALYDYCIYRYVANPRTIYKNMFKLEPGFCLEFDLRSFQIKKSRYWELKRGSFENQSPVEVINEIKHHIIDSVAKRMVADVEVSTFLSGGIDSSLITALAGKYNSDVRAFSIDIQPPMYSEVDYARNAADFLNVDLIVEKVGRAEFNTFLNTIVQCYDEPFADSSMIPTFLLCYHASKYTKVALSGDGGDEVFYGYEWYRKFQKKKSWLRKWKDYLISFSQKKTGCRDSVEKYRLTMFDRFIASEVAELFNLDDPFPDNNYLYKEKLHKGFLKPDDLNYLDFQTFLVDDILFKVDIASMAHSLEVRVPFLDHRLVEAAYNIDFSLLFRNDELKHVLKVIARDYLPEKNIYRPKKGFSAPVMHWIDLDIEEHLLSGTMVSDAFIDRKKLSHIIQVEKNIGKIWQLFMLELWYSSHYRMIRRRR